MGVLTDVCDAVGDELSPYCDEIMHMLIHNLGSDAVHRSIKPQASMLRSSNTRAACIWVLFCFFTLFCALGFMPACVCWPACHLSATWKAHWMAWWFVDGCAAHAALQS